MNPPLPAPGQIVIRDLEIHCHIGVPDAERAQPQRLLLTVEMDADFGAAGASDDLAQTIDYFAVSRRLLRFGEGRSWKLIETLAVDVADAVRAEFKVRSIAVEVKKFILPEARYVAVRLRRP
jgi:7,8-dihydroneopterin aldolase/epimerase/oxygenase